MNTLKKIAIAGAITVLPLIAFAQQTVNPKFTEPGDDPVQKVIDILNTLTNWLLTGLIVLAGIFIVLAAYNYLTSGGDAEKVGKAKDTLIYAAVAVAVGLLAKVLVALAGTLVK